MQRQNKFKIEMHDVVKRVDQGVVSANLENMLVLLHINNGKYYGLNNVCLRIWDYLHEAVQVKCLIEQLHYDFDVSKSKYQEDTLLFLEELLKHNLLQLYSNKVETIENDERRHTLKVYRE